MKVVDQVSTRILRETLAEFGRRDDCEVYYEDSDDVKELTARVGTECVPMIFTNDQPTQEALERQIRREFRRALDNRPVRRFKRRK